VQLNRKSSPTHNPGEGIVTPWVVHCDGASCDKGADIAAIVTSPTRVVIRYAARLDFTDDVHSANNTTEYEDLLLSLRKIPKSFKNTSRKRAKQGIQFS
jgi:hypothetical protein